MNYLRYIFCVITCFYIIPSAIAQNTIADSLLYDRWQIIAFFSIKPINKQNNHLILYKKDLSIERKRFVLEIYHKKHRDLEFMVLKKNYTGFFERRWEVGHHGMLDPITKPPYKIERITNWEVIGDTLKMLWEAPLYRKKGLEIKPLKENILLVNNSIMITCYYNDNGKIGGLSLYRRVSVPEEKIPFFQNDYSMYEFALPFIKADYPDIVFIEED
jgi:hypothetical protein